MHIVPTTLLEISCHSSILHLKLRIFSYRTVIIYILVAQKNCLIETVLLSTHNIYFGGEIRNIFLFIALSYLEACSHLSIDVMTRVNEMH